jgi:hypothetical protein
VKLATWLGPGCPLIAFRVVGSRGLGATPGCIKKSRELAAGAGQITWRGSVRKGRPAVDRRPYLYGRISK